VKLAQGFWGSKNDIMMMSIAERSGTTYRWQIDLPYRTGESFAYAIASGQANLYPSNIFWPYAPWDCGLIVIGVFMRVV
jgi:hypothetical protein